MFKNYLWLIPCATVAGWFTGGFAAGIVTLMMTKLYESSAVIRVQAPPTGPGDGSLSLSHDETLKLLKNEAIKDAANHFAEKKDAQYPATLELGVIGKAITCESVDGTETISIRARLRGKIDARDAVEFLIDSVIQRTIQVTEKESSELRKVIEELEKLELRRTEITNGLKPRPSFWNPASQKPKEPGRRTSGGLLGLAADGELAEIQRQATELQQQHDSLVARIKAKSIHVQVVRHPEISNSPVYPVIDFNLAVGRLAGVVVVWIAVWFGWRTRSRIKGPMTV